ncbi:hypothetical protein HK100_006901 [Physocladia obscura]|uniref:Uncharacterized protein n=1 Tax=Physocladia obscura TaxID=109957 RepID=A0AAD5SQW7_9FUNG|nr:hypothetical protein HK100_006901 [Physocladia obscura]
MGNVMVKMPSFTEIKDARPAPPNAVVPEPKWWFNIPLRYVILVILAAYAIMGIVGLAQLDILGLVLDIFGFLAVFRLVPEWMVAYGWALVVLFIVDLIRCITWAILGSFAHAFVTLAFQALFTFSMIGCLLALRTYALACSGIGI